MPDTPASTTSFFVPIRLNGEETGSATVVIDTGSDVSVIDARLLPNGISLEDSTLTVDLVSGIQQSVGRVLFHTEYKGYALDATVDVINLPQPEVILGRDWMFNNAFNFVFPGNDREIVIESRVIRRVIGSNNNSKADIDRYTNGFPKKQSAFLEVCEPFAPKQLPPSRSYDFTMPFRTGVTEKDFPKFKRYSLGTYHREELRKYLDASLEAGIIRRSDSPLVSPMFFVPKASGELRPVVDYRALNKLTKVSPYTVPVMRDLLNELGNAQIFTRIDLKGAYNLIRVAESETWKTAFICDEGQFEYLVMPFGVQGAPATFQRFMDDIFYQLRGQCVIVYLDDILVYSKTIEEHSVHVSKVLHVLKTNTLKINADKSEFYVYETEFLGHVLKPGAIGMQPAKIEVIENWPTPKSVKQVQSLLGFTNFYRQFIPNYTQLVLPIQKLVNQRIKFSWTVEQDNALAAIKKAFSSSPLLATYNPAYPIRMWCDASDQAIGAMIAQKQPSGKWMPIAFHSRKLDAHQIHYHIHDKEFMSMVEAASRWKYYLLSAEQIPVFLTDHANLKYLSEKRTLSQRQLRLMEKLNEFSYYISVIKGKDNVVADALSRRYSVESFTTIGSLIDPSVVRRISADPKGAAWLVEYSDPALVEQLKKSIQEHHFLKDYYLMLSGEEAELHPDAKWKLEDFYLSERGVLFYRDQVVIGQSDSLIADVLYRYHDSLDAGHPGQQATLSNIAGKYWWPTRNRDVLDYVKQCHTCQMNKTPRTKKPGLLQPLPIPDLPFDSISMDFVGPLPESVSHWCSPGPWTAILVIVDRKTKFAQFLPTTVQCDAQELYNLFRNHVYYMFGAPKTVVSDRGAQFTSRLWRQLLKAHGARPSLTTSYRPQGDGQTENVNASLVGYLRNVVSDRHDDWVDWLPHAQFAYNIHLHSGLGCSPYEALMGFKPAVDLDLTAVTTSRGEPWIFDVELRMKTLRQHLEKAQKKQADAYNKHRREVIYNMGDEVLLSTAHLNTDVIKRKFQRRWIGPFKVVQRLSSNVYRLQLPGEWSRIHSTFNVDALRPFHENTFLRRKPQPHPAENLDFFTWNPLNLVSINAIYYADSEDPTYDYAYKDPSQPWRTLFAGKRLSELAPDYSDLLYVFHQQKTSPMTDAIRQVLGD